MQKNILFATKIRKLNIIQRLTVAT